MLIFYGGSNMCFGCLLLLKAMSVVLPSCTAKSREWYKIKINKYQSIKININKNRFFCIYFNTDI